MAVLLHACGFHCYLNHLKFTIACTPADDLLQAVNSITFARSRAKNFFAHIPKIVHVGGLETEAIITNKCVPLRYVLVSRLLWFCGFKRL